jgi:DNA-binding CsgD family transcriptional regulator
MIMRLSEILNGTLGMFDMHQKKIPFFRSSVDKEHETSHLFRWKDGDIPFWKHIVPDDIPFVIDTIKTSFNYLNGASNNEKKQFKLILDFCCHVSEGVRRRFILKLATFMFDKKDKIWLILFSIASFPQKPLHEKPHRRMTNVKTGKCMLFQKEQKMTERTIEILKLTSLGLTSKEIAEKLHLSITTVETHRQNMLTNTFSKNTCQALLYAIKTELIMIE